jgi:uncharacterized membrane protein
VITKVRHYWQETLTSFWFIPALIVLAAVLLASGLIAIDSNIELHVDKRWPLLFGASPAASRGLLTAVASSMITVAGVVFSITIVALSLTSSQYTSRVLRNFMGDRINQTVLGVFLGIFAYCLVVLRTIRDGDEGGFVPSLAVMGALAQAFVGIGFLIFFIHHISMSIQASNVIASAASETLKAVDQLFPKNLGKVEDEDLPISPSDDSVWSMVDSNQTGYIESVDGDRLLALADELQTVFRMEKGIGDFVVEGEPLISISSSQKSPDEISDDVNRVYIIGRQRTVQQDAAFGIRQLVDIALKALSPGVNDTTTAVMCIDYLSAILCLLASRDIPTPQRKQGGQLRLIARGPSFESLLNESFDQMRLNAEGNVVILVRLLEALRSISFRTPSVRRRVALKRHVEDIAELITRTISTTRERTHAEDLMKELLRTLDECVVETQHGPSSKVNRH